MRAPRADATVFELLPHRYLRNEVEFAVESDKHYSLQDDKRRQSTGKEKLAIKSRTALKFVPLMAAVALVVIPLAYAPSLSSHFGETGCLPNGDFALPYTHSIWDTSQFLSITIGFTGPDPSECTSSNTAGWMQGCIGYTFSSVKAIDVAFDVLLGRGGQLALAMMAYRLFSRVLTSLMQRGEVGYEVFSAVAFQTGSLFSLWPLLKHSVWRAPVPRTKRARWLYFWMALSTLYLLVVPTLVSAMTGYTARYVPYVSNTTYTYDNATDRRPEKATEFVDCGGSLTPIWGRLDRVPSFGLEYTVTSMFVPPDDDWGPDWDDYLNRYQSVYDDCGDQSMASCSGAQMESWVTLRTYREQKNYTLPAPVVGVEAWPVEDRHYTHWDCGNSLLMNDWLNLYGKDDPESLETIESQGVCMADSRYVWGFSFLLTLVTCILNLLFAVIMYGVWWDLRRHADGKPEPPHSLFKDAAVMISMAQEQYGDRVFGWSAETLDRDVLKGRKGMTLRERRKYVASASRDEDMGDPRDGDWGG